MNRILSAIVLMSLIFPSGLLGQETQGLSSGATRERAKKLREFYLMEKQLEEATLEPDESPDVTLDSEEDLQEIEASLLRFPLTEIDTGSSAILTSDELQVISVKYEGREVTIQDLFAAVQEINDLYQMKGFSTAKAFLPVQKIANGHVFIKLIEARYDKIQVLGNDTTRDSYLINGLSLSSGDLVSLETLKRKLTFFNAVNDIRVRSELKRGEDEGTTDNLLFVEEPPQHQLVAYTDNAGREETGEERLGLFYTNRSLFGVRDAFSLGGNLTEGGESFHASYDLPVNSRGTRIGAYYDYDSTEVISGPLDGLDIEGESTDVALSLKHPLVVKERSDLRGYSEFHWKDAKTDFEGITLFETDVRSLVLGAHLSLYDDSGFWFIDNSITVGFDSFGGDKSFLNYNIDIARRQNLTQNVFLLIKASAQKSDSDLLPSSEQFQIGGISTVRGYSEGVRVGDEGYVVNVELNFPLSLPEVDFIGSPLNESVRGLVFFDHGGAFPYKGNNESSNSDDYLTSVGAGLAFNFNSKISGRLYFGVPLATREPDQDDVSAHFFLQFSPFD